MDGGAQGFPQHTPTEGEFDRADPMRAEPIVAHPFEAPGQDMEEKPAEACDRVERHRALPMPRWSSFPWSQEKVLARSGLVQ